MAAMNTLRMPRAISFGVPTWDQDPSPPSHPPLAHNQFPSHYPPPPPPTHVHTQRPSHVPPSTQQLSSRGHHGRFDSVHTHSCSREEDEEDHDDDSTDDDDDQTPHRPHHERYETNSNPQGPLPNLWHINNSIVQAASKPKARHSSQHPQPNPAANYESPMPLSSPFQYHHPHYYPRSHSGADVVAHSTHRIPPTHQGGRHLDTEYVDALRARVEALENGLAREKRRADAFMNLAASNPNSTIPSHDPASLQRSESARRKPVPTSPVSTDRIYGTPELSDEDLNDARSFAKLEQYSRQHSRQWKLASGLSSRKNLAAHTLDDAHVLPPNRTNTASVPDKGNRAAPRPSHFHKLFGRVHSLLLRSSISAPSRQAPIPDASYPSSSNTASPSQQPIRNAPQSALYPSIKEGSTVPPVKGANPRYDRRSNRTFGQAATLDHHSDLNSEVRAQSAVFRRVQSYREQAADTYHLQEPQHLNTKAFNHPTGSVEENQHSQLPRQRSPHALHDFPSGRSQTDLATKLSQKEMARVQSHKNPHLSYGFGHGYGGPMSDGPVQSKPVRPNTPAAPALPEIRMQETASVRSLRSLHAKAAQSKAALGIYEPEFDDEDCGSCDGEAFGTGKWVYGANIQRPRSQRASSRGFPQGRSSVTRRVLSGLGARFHT